jgi:hypothetical protein
MKGLLLGFLALVPLAARADDMQKYLSDTQDLVRQGKHEEALERFLWFHEHALEHQPSMSGVRLSFALSYWKQLGDDYPPALEAMVDVRDSSTRQVMAGEGDRHLFQDVAALNRTLGDGQNTVELFQTLDAQQPKLAKTCWTVARHTVIEGKRFDLARKYMGNPAEEFDRIKQSYDQNVTLYDKPQIGGASFKNYNQKHFVEECLQLIEVVNELDGDAAAKQIQEKALAVRDDRRLRDALGSE